MVTVKKPQAVQVVYDFFHYFEKWLNQPKAEIGPELEHHLAKSFTIFSNGKPVAKSADEYKKRMLLFKEKYSQFKISEPLEEPIVTGNQAIIHYRVDLKTHKGEKKHVQIMAMAKIEDNKIARWIQVASEQDNEGWDVK